MDGKDMGNSKGTKGGMYVPNGNLQGDSASIPSKGTGTGVTDTYGADIGGDATNRIGSMTKTDSDSPFNNLPRKPHNGSY